MKANKDYEKKLHKILKTYNSILVKCKNIPILSDKNIVMVENIASIINAQMETRKPIIYFQEIQSISFILLDGTEAYIYILKANETITTELERTINNFDIERNTFVKEILSKIERILLNGNIGKENILTAKELKYLESIKEEGLVEKNLNKEKVNNNNEYNIKDDNVLDNQKQNDITDTKELRGEENDSSKNLYLVPVKNIGFFKKNKKARRLNARKRERRMEIG